MLISVRFVRGCVCARVFVWSDRLWFAFVVGVLCAPLSNYGFVWSVLGVCCLTSCLRVLWYGTCDLLCVLYWLHVRLGLWWVVSFTWLPPGGLCLLLFSVDWL